MATSAKPIFNTGVVPGYDDALSRSERARTFADALRRRMFEPVAPPGVSVGALAALQPLALGIIAGQNDQLADDSRKEASETYRKFIEGEQAAIGMIADPKKRAERAMQSPVPQFQKFGETILGRMPKLTDLAKVSTPQTALEGMRSGDEALFRAAPKFENVGGVPLPVQGDGTLGPPAIQPFFKLTQDPNDPTQKVQQNTLSGQIGGLRPGETRIENNVGPDGDAYKAALAKAGGSSFVKAIDDSYDRAMGAIKDTQILKRAVEQLQNNPTLYSGPTADVRSTAVLFADVLGLAPDDALRNATDSSVLQRMLSERVLAKAKSLGTGSGFSNTDLKFLEEATKGRGLPVEGLFKLFDLGIMANLGEVAQHQKLLQRSSGPEVPPSFLGQKDLSRTMSEIFDTPVTVSPVRDPAERERRGFVPLGPPTPRPAQSTPGAGQRQPSTAPGQPMSAREYLERARRGGQ